MRIAEATVGAVRNRKVVRVEPQVGTGMRERSAADLIGPLQPRRACVAGVESDCRREGESRAEGNNSAEVPSAKNRIGHSALVQELLAFPHRQQVIDASDPAFAIVVVREPFFRREVVAVLRPGSLAADFGLVVDSLAESKGAQEIEAVASPLLGLELKGVIGGVSVIHDRGEGPILAVRGGHWVAEGAKVGSNAACGVGIWFSHAGLQVSSFGPDVTRANHDVTRKLVFEIPIPLVINRRMRTPVLAGQFAESASVGSRAGNPDAESVAKA